MIQESEGSEDLGFQELEDRKIQGLDGQKIKELKDNRMQSKGLLELEGMEFHAYHGCLEHEKTEGNTFIVDFKAEIDVIRPALSDNLEDTLNYAVIYDLVAEEMGVASNLIENVAGRIVSAIESRFPELEFSVRVSKKNPPVDGVASWSRITLHSSFQG